MSKETLSIKTSDDRILNTYAYHPEGTSKGIVHILHGMGEHAGRYDAFSEYLSKNGLTVYAHDHRNHGKSVQDDRGVGFFAKNETFETMVEDVRVVQDYILKNESGQPITLLGHSMGSAILRRYLETDPPAPTKAVVIGTLPRYTVLSGGLLYILSLISGLFFKKESRNRFVNFLMNKSMTKGIAKSGELDWLSHDPKVIKKYEDDPLSGFVYNKYFYNSLFKSLIKLNRKSEIEKTSPVRTLFISGYDDPLSKNMHAIHKLVATYEKRVGDFEAEIKPIYKARHEILNETNREYTFDYLLDWIMNK